MGHDREWLAECRERAPEIAQRFADGMGQGERRLSAPGCPKGCAPCFRECAVRHISADWWIREHAEAEAEAPIFFHNGVAYKAGGRLQ